MAGPSVISAREFVRHTAVWRDTVPTLEQVVRWCNTQQSSLGRAVPNRSGTHRNSFLSELALRLAASDLGPSDAIPEDIKVQARNFIASLPRGNSVGGFQLSDIELSEVLGLRRALLRFTSRRHSVVFGPVVPGCGVVDQAVGDIRCDGEIVEVKAVTRPFRSADLRQLLTYAAMYYASGDPMRFLTLVNPRRARAVRLPLDMLAAGASGRSDIEVMQDLVEWMVGLQVSG